MDFVNNILCMACVSSYIAEGSTMITEGIMIKNINVYVKFVLAPK